MKIRDDGALIMSQHMQADAVKIEHAPRILQRQLHSARAKSFATVAFNADAHAQLGGLIDRLEILEQHKADHLWPARFANGEENLRRLARQPVEPVAERKAIERPTGTTAGAARGGGSQSRNARQSSGR